MLIVLNMYICFWSGDLKQRYIYAGVVKSLKYVCNSNPPPLVPHTCSLSPSQMKVLMYLGLPFLFDVLKLFVHWIQVGWYDFHALPFTLKAHLKPGDVKTLRQISEKYDGEHPLGITSADSTWCSLKIIL